MLTPAYIARPPDGESPAIPLPGRGRPLPPHLAALRDKLRPGPLSGVRLPFGDPSIDACLPGGGLPLGHLHEIGAAALDAETGTLPAAFVANLLARIAPTRPVVWIAPAGDLYCPGLLAHGLDPGRLVLVRPDKDHQTLAAMEVALREAGAAAVVAEVGAFDRTASRRLQFACLGHGVTGFVLRRWPHGRKAADRDASAAVTRWRLAAVPSQREGREPGRPRWHVALTHARGGRPGAWIMEVEEVSDDATHPLRVVAALADHAPVPDRARRAG